MTTSVVTSLPAWLAGCTYDASGGNDLRNSTVTAMLFDEGVISGASAIGVLAGVIGGGGLGVTPGGGMTVNVGPGSYAVPAATATAGGYTSTLQSQANLTVQTADPSNPRIDIIVAWVNDTGTSSSQGFVQYVPGTPAASPSPPAAPSTSSVVLATLTIPAGTSTVTSGMIADSRVYTVAAGGVLVAPKASAPVGYPGLIAYDKGASSSFYHLDGSPRQMRTLPFGPIMKVTTADWSYPNASGPGLQTITGLSANITTDGSTDIKVTYHVGSVSGWSGGTPILQHAILVDGDVIDLIDEQLQQNSGQQGGFTAIAFTSSAAGNTPNAGPHTVTFAADTDSGAAGFPKIHLISGCPTSAWMRVEPVVL